MTVPMFTELAPANRNTTWAGAIVAHSNQVAAEILRLYRMSRENVWARTAVTIADAQAMLDAINTASPGQAARMFQVSAALGAWIEATMPGTLATEELSSLVPYTLDPTTGRIVLTGVYFPTEANPTLDWVAAEAEIRAAKVAGIAADINTAVIKWRSRCYGLVDHKKLDTIIAG